MLVNAANKTAYHGESVENGEGVFVHTRGVNRDELKSGLVCRSLPSNMLGLPSRVVSWFQDMDAADGPESFEELSQYIIP
jgi:hypothetical protein